MDFVAVMLFSWSLYKVFQLECLMLLIIEIIIISNQISAWSCLSKSFYKKACNILSQSSKKEERTLPHETIFVFIYLVFHWDNIVKKFLPKAGVQKKVKKEGWSYSRVWGGVWGVGGYGRGIKPFAHYALKCFKTKLMDIRLNNSRPNWAKIVLLLEKRIF